MRKVIRASEEAKANKIVSDSNDELRLEDVIIEKVDTITDRWNKYADRLSDVDLSLIDDDKLKKINDILGKMTYMLIDISDIIYKKPE